MYIFLTEKHICFMPWWLGTASKIATVCREDGKMWLSDSNNRQVLLFFQYYFEYIYRLGKTIVQLIIWSRLIFSYKRKFMDKMSLDIAHRQHIIWQGFIYMVTQWNRILLPVAYFLYLLQNEYFCHWTSRKIKSSKRMDVLTPRQHGCHFADGIFKTIFLKEN